MEITGAAKQSIIKHTLDTINALRPHEIEDASVNITEHTAGMSISLTVDVRKINITETTGD